MTREDEYWAAVREEQAARKALRVAEQNLRNAERKVKRIVNQSVAAMQQEARA